MRHVMIVLMMVTPLLAQEPGKVEISEEEITVFGEQRLRMQARKDPKELDALEEQLRQRFGLNRPSPSPDRLLDTSVYLSNCARLEVSTKPDGAELYLDSHMLGRSPLSASNLRGGRHTLAIRRRGYELWTSTILLPPWERTRLHPTLDRRIRYELDTVWDTESRQILPSGLAVLKSGEVFVSGGGKVKLWVDGRPVRDLEAPGMVEPRGMGFSPEGRYIYVADPGCHTIWCFEIQTGRLVRTLKVASEEQLHQPSDVAVAGDGTVLVCDSGNHRLVWFSPQGTWIKSLGEQGDSPGQFNHPEGVALGEDGTIYVADWGNNRVQVLSSDGIVLRAFGTRGIAPGSLQGPTGICLEEGGYLLVVDSQNDRVQRYRRDGRLVSVLPEAKGMGPFTKPFSAALDPSGAVYVTQRDRHGILVLWQVWEQEYLSDLRFTNLRE